jgi:hypothetical protein
MFERMVALCIPFRFAITVRMAATLGRALNS